jgi:protein-export membrane protein SecD
MSKGKSITIFALIIALIACMAHISIFGFKVGDYLFPSVLDKEYGIRQGLDLVGGSSVTFEAAINETATDSESLDAGMESVVNILRTRLNNMGFFEANIIRVGERRVTVEIPSIQDPEEAIQNLGATAQLEFKDSDGNVILTGDQVKNATPNFGKVNQSSLTEEYFVSLEFDNEGSAKFAEATARVAGLSDESKRFIAITLDGTPQSQPMVNEAITGGSCIIHGSFDEESVQWLANLISSGRLPFTLTEVESRNVGPLLGEEALETCLKAGAIGLLLVMLFMIVIYKLPGLISAIVLIGYVAVVCLILGGLRVNLSLPGIAGIVLSIGMAVDANVVIFERIKEELNSDKSLKASIASGFNRAFTAIFDANITTIIAAGVLYWFGTGPIKGFALTLFIGIVVSMFTAIVVTKFMLKLSVALELKDPKFYGAKSSREGM